MPWPLVETCDLSAYMNQGSTVVFGPCCLVTASCMHQTTMLNALDGKKQQQFPGAGYHQSDCVVGIKKQTKTAFVPASLSATGNLATPSQRHGLGGFLRRKHPRPLYLSASKHADSARGLDCENGI